MKRFSRSFQMRNANQQNKEIPIFHLSDLQTNSLMTPVLVKVTDMLAHC